MAAQVRLDHKQGNHHPQVIEHTDGATDHQGAEQPPLLRLHASSDYVELADKPGRQRNASQRQHHHGEHRGQVRAAPEQPTVFIQSIGITAAVGRRHQGNHAECTQAGQHIGGQVHANRFHGQALAGDQRNQQVAKVGNGGITEQTLEVVLQQRQQVAEDDRGDGDQRQQVIQPAACGSRRHLIQTQQHGKHGDLTGRGEEGCHRSRRALVNVRCP